MFLGRTRPRYTLSVPILTAITSPLKLEKTYLVTKILTMVTKRTHRDSLPTETQMKWVILKALYRKCGPGHNSWLDKCISIVTDLTEGKKFPLWRLSQKIPTNGSSFLQSSHRVFKSLHKCSWWSIPVPICKTHFSHEIKSFIYL